LLHKALEEAGVKANTAYGVPVLVAFSEVDDTAPARLLKKFVKEVPTVSILGGVVSGQYYDKSQMLALADLPSKPEMLAKLVGTIQAPVSSFVNVLAGNIRGLVNVLNAIATK
jgi:large subunit ribosomal protein L10